MVRAYSLKGAGLCLVALLAACGGKVFVDGAGGAGAGGAGGAPISTTGPSSSTGVTPGPCSKHDDCPGGLCVFATGTCARACESDFCPNCDQGTVCEFCATSSCPACDDCLPACMPAEPWRCDENDPCPAGQVCIFASRTCAPACSADGQCDAFSFCDQCVTGSCCGCEDCVSACVGGE